jgi:hypothetical protein
MVVRVDGEPLGVMQFSVPDWRAGDLIPRGQGKCYRVVDVCPAEGDELPTLVVAPVAA